MERVGPSMRGRGHTERQSRLRETGPPKRGRSHLKGGGDPIGEAELVRGAEPLQKTG